MLTQKSAAILGLLMFLVIFGLADTTTYAGGGGFITIQPIEVCRNGIRFQAFSTDELSLYHGVESAVVRGHNNIYGYPSAFVNAFAFQQVNQPTTVDITYPPSTFAVGEAVAIRMWAIDGTPIISANYTYINDCLLEGYEVSCYTNSLRGDFALLENGPFKTITAYSGWDGTCTGIAITNYSAVIAATQQEALANCQANNPNNYLAFVWDYELALWGCVHS